MVVLVVVVVVVVVEDVDVVFFTFLLVVAVELDAGSEDELEERERLPLTMLDFAVVLGALCSPSSSPRLPRVSLLPPLLPPPRLGNLGTDEWEVSTTPRCFAAF